MGAGSDILQVLARIEQKVDRILAARGGSSGPKVADDRDLDGKYGDEEIKKDPPRWQGGESFAGRRMSECSPEFLDCFAEFKDYCADRDEEKAALATGEEQEKKAKFARFSRISAARARGWAARLRSGWKRPGSDNNDELGWG
jgi:hypothetical protein